MTSRPLYRRVSFWLGLFVACFLAWAWWDSYRNGTSLACSWKTGSLWVVQADGSFYIASGEIRSPGWWFSRYEFDVRWMLVDW
ncbi:hypothetical protein OKA05_00495 [Luteolibacter arcticus]|uniref:Uncharacterized protein n=1 Tax=Luteolibacter arcticus TaxID=1581411 RepID=A0ABT3GBK8_9BACT|nr:hypothetical protein [Luteolibacter arcticus]MCW1921011.1 hypothetical protein [Luteolibacter arcticus]